MVAAFDFTQKFFGVSSPRYSFFKKDNKSLGLLKSRFFFVRGFFLYLTFTPHAFFLSPAASVSTLRNPITFSSFSSSNHPAHAVSLSSLWAHWGSFFGVTSSLAAAKVTFLWGGSSELLYFSHALSWFSWRASFVAWRLYTTTRQLPLHHVNGSYCALFFSDPQTNPASSYLRAQVPLLGVGDFAVRWMSWAYVYSIATPRSLQLLFLGCVAKSLTFALRLRMETSFIFLVVLSLCCLLFCFIQAWHYAVLLALVELAWVVLIGVYSSLCVSFLDLSFLYWGLLLFLFSAVEVVLGFLSFLLYNKQNQI